jgi:hypothetical protein
VSTTPTATPPSWLEAAARLDALMGDKVPLATAQPTAVTPPADVETVAPELPAPTRRIAAPIVVPDVGQRRRDEVDQGWYGYSAMALLPSTLFLGMLTAAALSELPRLVPAKIVVEVLYAPLAALWAGQIIRAAYRVFAYSYRLTNRRLFRERGRLYPAEEPIDLAVVARVDVKKARLGVGTVCVIPEESSGRAAVELTGVRRPRMLAAAVEQAARAAREGNVVVAGTIPVTNV